MSHDSPFLDRDPIPTVRALALLERGEIEVRGRMPYSSNATFLVDVVHDGLHAQAIYKPVRGERPLWDFPPGLHERELATFAMSEALGFGLVPPTVVRDDAPLDTGSLQLFVPSHVEHHYFTIREAGTDHDDELRRLAALDVVVNNTDRKSGHCLLGKDGRIWAIDNGLTFHAEFKLRTVIWDFGGEPLPDAVTDALAALLDRGLPAPVAEALTPFEREAALTRIRALVAGGCLPVDVDGRRWPWPLV